MKKYLDRTRKKPYCKRIRGISTRWSYKRVSIRRNRSPKTY